MSSAGEIASQVTANVLLFLLVFGMSSTVKIGRMKEQLRNCRAIILGLVCQFLLLPLIGFAVVEIFKLPPPVGITLLIVVSSPGGSYSNWWCSLLNADLALSVSMTTASTILSIGFLPANMLLYTHAAYGNDTNSSGDSIIDSLNFGTLFISIGVVIGAIALGMVCSAKFDTPRFHRLAYIGGNVSGILLILFSIVGSFVSPSDGSPDPSEATDGTSPAVYAAIILPCIVGLLISATMATLVKLPSPERITTAVECCYQNTGIATSAALSLFSGDDLQAAMRVPFVYGIAEIVFIGCFMLIAWKLGWSKAPRDETICKVITKSYELDSEHEPNVDEEGDEEQVGSDERQDGGPQQAGSAIGGITKSTDGSEESFAGNGGPEQAGSAIGGITRSIDGSEESFAENR